MYDNVYLKGVSSSQGPFFSEALLLVLRPLFTPLPCVYVMRETGLGQENMLQIQLGVSVYPLLHQQSPERSIAGTVALQAGTTLILLSCYVYLCSADLV
jgi:hypothetical protein